MKRFIETNINDYVKVKLTDEGKKIFNEFYADLFKGYHNSNELSKKAEEQLHTDKDGYVKFQIHEFMNIFGEHTTVGSLPVCETNTLFFEVNNEYEDLKEIENAADKYATERMQYERDYLNSLNVTSKDDFIKWAEEHIFVSTKRAYIDGATK